MSHECVVGIYDSFAKAKEAIQALEHAKFPAEQVSLVTHNIAGELPDRESLGYGDEAERDAARGAEYGGLIGALLGSPLLMIGGVGPVLIAGPLAIGLVGAVVGGFLGAMTGWGVHTDHVRRYERKVAEGALLVVANGNPQQVAEAERILWTTEADEIHLHAESSADSVEA